MSGGVFICYRREESAFAARAIHDRVVERLKRDNVFLDVDSIELGVDWLKELTERVGACDALVAVIGKTWISTAGRDNQRRIDDPDDFVRIEIEAALRRDIRVIPVLVDGAAMPRPGELPDSLKGLARRQGIEVSHAQFDADVEKLTRALASILDARRARDDAGAAQRAEEGERPQEAAKARRQRKERETAQANSPAPPQSKEPLASAPSASLSPPRDWSLGRLVLGAWYDRGENEYVISERSSDGGRRTSLQALQKNRSLPHGSYVGAAWVKGEIVGFNAWLPLMGGFEGRLVRSSERSDLETLVGRYSTAERSWDVTLYRSPAPPEPGPRDVPELTDFLKKLSLWRK